MANKLTPEQLQMLLANMRSLKESRTEIAEDNTGKKKLKNIPLKNKKLEDAIYSYIQNKQDNYSGPSINKYDEGAHNPNVAAERAIQAYKENSDLAKTMGSFTPSGDSKIGAIGAETVANMTPMGSGQLLAAKRLASIFNNPKDNEYVNESKGTFDNALGAFNLLGDLGMIGGTLKTSGVIPKSSTILSKYAKILNEKANNKFTPYETVSEEVNAAIPKEIAAQPKTLAEASKALASGESIAKTAEGASNAGRFNLERTAAKTKRDIINKSIQDGGFNINTRGSSTGNLFDINIKSPTGKISANRNKDGTYRVSFEDQNAFNAGKSMLKLKGQLAGKTIYETKSFSPDSYTNILKLKSKLPFEEAGYIPLNSSNKNINFLDDLILKNEGEWTASAGFKSEEAAKEGARRMDEYMAKLGENGKSKIVNNNGKFEVHVPNYKINIPERISGKTIEVLKNKK